MTSLKAALGFFADFLKSGAQSAIPVAMTSGLPASDRTNDISNYRLDTRRYSRCCQCQIARWNVP